MLKRPEAAFLDGVQRIGTSGARQTKRISTHGKII
jgi:hypothetical protein